MRSGILPKGTLRYVFMPEVVSRMNTLVLGGFHYIPFFIASVYCLVRLLPANHPYVNPKHIGRFGIRHVIAEAANNVVIDRKNIDKFLVFSLVLLGLIILFVQICVLVMGFIFPSVFAFPANWNGFFVVNPVAERHQDLAFIMLDMVFGVPNPANPIGPPAGEGFFESCVANATVCEDNFGNNIIDPNLAGTGVPVAISSVMGPLASNANSQFPFPLHLGLHRLFAVYSMGLLVVAVFIAGYFIATILAETAQSGTPFGRRYNKMWAPLRLVMAFGLLVPLQVGLNSSQYLVLYAAKFGSAFATNGWKYFNITLTENYLGAANDLIAVPTLPEVGAIGNMLFLARVCRFAYVEARGTGAPNIQPYLILAQSKAPANAVPITAAYTYNAAQAAAEPLATVLTVSFGEYDVARYPTEQGNVKPFCGQMEFHLADPRRVAGPAPYNIPPEPGPRIIQEYFFHLVRDMWHYGGGLNAFEGGGVAPPGDRARQLAWQTISGTPPGPGAPLPDVPYVANVTANIHASLTTALTNAVAAQLLSPRWNGGWVAGDPVFRKGWAAAGIWYNRIAEMNHPISIATSALPEMTKLPLLLDELRKKKGQYNVNTYVMDLFSAKLGGVDDTQTLLSAEDGMQIAATLNEAFKIWTAGLGSTELQMTGNPFLDFISGVLGTSGLYDMRRNPNTHPLAMLSSIGRSLIDRSVRLIGTGLVINSVGILMVFADMPQAKLASVFASFCYTIAMIAITAGFVLAYIIPFLPFLYFFFAVGGWIKGIFEAMVGAPLWALAHIRIDAQGLPGNAALNGYYLIFEVFLRPILCVFGLLAAISIYSALVSALNNTFDIMVQNVGGFDISAELTTAPTFIDFMRGPIDEFFYTIIYAILVYMMGMSSFKLIDTIPNNILRWMGQSVATFGDMREDPAQNLVGKAAFGSQQIASKMGGALGGMSKLSDPKTYQGAT